jgi:hypothetical protein
MQVLVYTIHQNLYREYLFKCKNSKFILAAVKNSVKISRTYIAIENRIPIIDWVNFTTFLQRNYRHIDFHEDIWKFSLIREPSPSCDDQDSCEMCVSLSKMTVKFSGLKTALCLYTSNLQLGNQAEPMELAGHFY